MNNYSSSPPLTIAIAVITDTDGRVLLAKRPNGKIFTNLWEFPGGKIEQSETPSQALQRECREEVGIELVRANAWLHYCYAYTSQAHEFHVLRVLAEDFSGEARGLEGQTLIWVAPSELREYPMPAANAVIIEALLSTLTPT